MAVTASARLIYLLTELLLHIDNVHSTSKTLVEQDGVVDPLYQLVEWPNSLFAACHISFQALSSYQRGRASVYARPLLNRYSKPPAGFS